MNDGANGAKVVDTAIHRRAICKILIRLKHCRSARRPNTRRPINELPAMMLARKDAVILLAPTSSPRRT